ncbi:tRNA (adenosine(37)-N6)-threonylcarbamoyltransferase complex ATPase subunit type 1 TsaE [Pseudoxanthomonas kalamensis DSM 18571]|uniref:tRNA (adenosine(37)-N6)-threonylcarbamoyltransferase complex ATPase subunit type 1 TsaE n=1 Tax=Pseudoxanthomonas kalamensis TaxID=289483 RepID=UPI001391C09B|nr:tRNA (adenosine(37)-N6)-threonylcarbamoyltransferase complex ATPase subunit type 1 TsaE [Pseudoxanthomonas kalamensis]KAF1709979.1 tRNA (adenosine(37)-N6)-threonylcarbamoyltransferase complex ATPase subunit type 1 TsaE [Pseudoxanthomonas kalamensis DSM 18571]
MRCFLPDTAATETLGSALGLTRPETAVIHLQGDLGAGKSTLARALLRRLGVQGAIRSPTYTLVERYPLEDGEAWHLDLYRIAEAAELDFLGLDEGEARLWLVEWPERGGNALPAADLRLELAVEGQGRSARLLATSPTGEAWLQRLPGRSELREILSGQD